MQIAKTAGGKKIRNGLIRTELKDTQSVAGLVGKDARKRHSPLGTTARLGHMWKNATPRHTKTTFTAKLVFDKTMAKRAKE